MSSVLRTALESTWQTGQAHPLLIYGAIVGIGTPIHFNCSVKPLKVCFLVWSAWSIFYRIFLYPRFFSPLRAVPGPSLGHPLYGQFLAIMRGEAGIPQRAWVKEHGPLVRVVGPFGLERLIVMKPEAPQKILVDDWVDYPRVCTWFDERDA